MLLNKTAVITGAAQGIGKEIALRFAKAGAYVVIADIKAAEDVIADLNNLGHTGKAIALDITDSAWVERSVQEVLKERGSIDILVNNAGIIARGSILELTTEQWRKVIDVNVNGTFNLCKAVIPSMINKRAGRILNISSVAGKAGDITAAAAYGTSKGAMITMTRSLARQLAEYGITVNSIAPHAIETDMSSEWSEEKRRSVINDIPLKRMGTAGEVAAAALFLVSEEAGFITGETLNINGGFLMD